ncbi:MAG TPA: nucleotidyl transferase AbiEii/AbiGii toxin family protein [Candidatus Baltobacteraceae bacterium]|nr:nucleotidyl transferase AbiEii/AbiGii toxin family protein [Candidatus Baltobacteraceae bacterium]
MDEFARLSPGDRREIFVEVAGKMNVDVTIVEKDFWVCWILKSLFSLPPGHPQMVFKGGTSLSKAYGLIDRFSEDIDIVTVVDFYLSRGFADPDNAPSKSKRFERSEALDQACARYVAGDLRDELRNQFRDCLGREGDWELLVDPSDRYGHTLLFRYPLSVSGIEYSYIRSHVKIELGWRSADEPVENRSIVSYVSERFPNLLTQSAISCTVLGAERTFWEKITALHAESFRNEVSRFFSRHYSDVASIFGTNVGKAVVRDLGMLEAVRVFKERYYPSAWARYDLAVPGTLTLVPAESKVRNLAADYREMRMMFFSELIPFEEIMNTLLALQEEINKI